MDDHQNILYLNSARQSMAAFAEGRERQILKESKEANQTLKNTHQATRTASNFTLACWMEMHLLLWTKEGSIYP